MATAASVASWSIAVLKVTLTPNVEPFVEPFAGSVFVTAGFGATVKLQENGRAEAPALLRLLTPCATLAVSAEPRGHGALGWKTSVWSSGQEKLPVTEEPPAAE